MLPLHVLTLHHVAKAFIISFLALILTRPFRKDKFYHHIPVTVLDG